MFSGDVLFVVGDSVFFGFWDGGGGVWFFILSFLGDVFFSFLI